MNDATSVRALIYCRVSSTRQVREGSGLESQEARCRDYALTHSYEVEAVFPDDASGGGDFMRRPGMVALLSYLDAQPGKRYVVIFDDLKRFARDTEFHIQLRRAFRIRGAAVECLNFKFEETPEGKFIETVLAAQGELEREQNSRQVVQKMSARLKAGYWVFKSPIGMKYTRVAGHGKLLIRDEPLATLVEEAFRGFASGRFTSIGQVKAFFEAHPAFPRYANGEVHPTLVKDLLGRPIYCGYVDSPNWNISLVKGKHAPLVSFEVWNKVQERLRAKPDLPVRSDIRPEFPLRGFVACSCCGKPMTAGRSKGRNAYYSYYECQTKACTYYRKSVRAEKLTAEVEDLLRSLQPAPSLFSLIIDMLRDLWQDREQQVDSKLEAAREELAAVERKVGQLIDRISKTDSDTLITAYEKQVRVLEERRIALTEKLAQKPTPRFTFDETTRTACLFLLSPYKIWSSERLDDKRLVLKLAFGGRILYDRDLGPRPQICPYLSKC